MKLILLEVLTVKAYRFQCRIAQMLVLQSIYILITRLFRTPFFKLILMILLERLYLSHQFTFAAGTTQVLGQLVDRKQMVNGNLNIGYAGLNRWTIIYGGDSGTVYRTFIIDADPNQANNQAIESGRYIFETRIDSADLSGTWKDSNHLVSGKGMQIILS